jgi:hypothetical protein
VYLRFFHAGPLGPDGFDELVESCTYPDRLDDELFDFVLEEVFAFSGASFRELGHHCADSGAGFEEAFLDQVLDYLQGGVGMDLEVRGEGADGREGLAGLEFTADEGFFGGEDHLVEE